MSDQTQASKAATANFNIEAEVVFTIASRAPDISLSFNGLVVPNALLLDLSRLGWGVPHVPPPPGSAIEWVPDLRTGQDYTIHPWRVTEFRLTHSPLWTLEDEKGLWDPTLASLQRHGVRIAGAKAPEPVTPGSASSASIVAAGSALLLDPQPKTNHDAMESWSGVSGRQRTNWTWSEGPYAAVASLFPDAAAAAGLQANGGNAWMLGQDQRPKNVVGTRSLVQLLLADVRPDDPQVTKLAKLLGDDSSIMTLAPIYGGSESVLAFAVVPIFSAEMLTSNLRLRFPKAIIRS